MEEYINNKVTGGGEQFTTIDENESGSDSNEEVGTDELNVYNPSETLKDGEEDKLDLNYEHNEQNVEIETLQQNDVEEEGQKLNITNTKACFNPTASEIVMHDHNFMRKYKSTRFVGKSSQPGLFKIKYPVQQSGVTMSRPVVVPSHNNSIPNVILTTMDGKPFQLAPGSQILRFVRSSGETLPITEVNENLAQSVGYQIIGVPSTNNSALETVSANAQVQEEVSPNLNTLPISILSSNGLSVVSNANTQLPYISSEIIPQMAKSGKNSEVYDAPSANSEVIVVENSAKKGTTSENVTRKLELSVNGNDNVQQRFMYSTGLCRVCLLQKDHVLNIFMDVNIGPNGVIENSRGPHAASRYNIISALKTLLDVDVFYGDGLPDYICLECMDNLMSFSVFRKKVSIGQTKLQEVIAQVQGTPNITLLNDLGEKDIRRTDVFRHCDSIMKANEMIKSSSFSHCAVRYLPDRVLDKIFTAMATMVGFKSGKLKELEMYAIQEPYITAWFCYTCNLTIHGSHEMYAQHYVEVHEINDAEDVLFPCDVCGSSFSLSDTTGTSQNYAEHWLQHFFFHECNICMKKMPSMKGMWVHKRSAHSSTDKIYQCNICEKAFSKKAHLDAHKKTHLDPEDRKQHLNWCKICGKGLTSSLAAHIASVHSEERPWKCEICSKGFKRKEILNGHRSTVHYNLKKYQCELCGVYLKSHSSKAQHLLRHKGEKSHTCSFCDKGFYSTHALRSHMIKHKEGGENQCTICNKIFKRKIYLTEHMRLHTGEKPHECHICGKQIRMKSNYYKHMKIHSRRAFESEEAVTLEVDLT